MARDPFALSVPLLLALAGVAGSVSAGIPAVVSLASLNGSNGFRVDGIDANDRSGFSVASAGDVNGDAIGDLVIGAPSADAGGDGYAGQTCVVFGRQATPANPFPASLDLGTLDGTNGFRIDGIDGLNLSGFSVASAGDVNGDTIADLVIGAFNADAGGDTYAGETYVVFGRQATPANPFPASLDLSTLDGTNGFRIDGIDENDFSGISVASAGDVNGDSIADLIIGAPGADPGGDSFAGETYIVFGRQATPGNPFPFPAALDLSTLDGTNGFRIDGIDPEDRSGNSVASAGDVNGDTINDVIIGAYGAGNGYAGETYIVFGRQATPANPFPASLDLGILDGTNGFRIDGIDAGDRSGSSVASAGDVNADGIADLVIGARNADPNGDESAGETYVVFGRQATRINPFPFPASLDLSTLDGSNGFRIDGIDENDFSGISVASAGDVNGDSINDVIIGAYGAGNGYTGETYIVFGRHATPADPFPASLDLGILDGTNGFRIDGIEEIDRSGFSVASGSDVNGDTIADIIIGAPNASRGEDPNAGETYILFGPGCPGDVNGDGQVRGADLSVLLAQFGQSIPPWSNADLNGDGQVDGRDLSVLLSNFGKSC